MAGRGWIEFPSRMSWVRVPSPAPKKTPKRCGKWPLSIGGRLAFWISALPFNGMVWLSMLETIREYALERLSAVGEDPVDLIAPSGDRHLSFQITLRMPMKRSTTQR